MKFDILQEVELHLRKLIKDTLISQSGYSEKVIPDNILKIAKKRKEKRESPWKLLNKKENELIDYFNFGDYYKIIIFKENWNKHFKEIFRDEKILYTKLSELETLRNDIAHQRELKDDELLLLKLNSEHILKCILENSKDRIFFYDGMSDTDLTQLYKSRCRILEKMIGIISGKEDTGLIRIEPKDMVAIMQGSDKIITVEHKVIGPNFEEKIKKILVNEKLPKVNGMLLFVEGGESMGLDHFESLVLKINTALSDDCNIIWSLTINKDLKNTILLQAVLVEPKI